MDKTEELARAKQELHAERDGVYTTKMNGPNTFEVSPDKFITTSGGTPRLWSLETAYKAHFVDPEPALEASIRQADGTFVICTQEEWDNMFIEMRKHGAVYFDINERLIQRIEALTVDDTLSTIWDCTWAIIEAE